MAKIPKVSGNAMIRYLIKKGFSIKSRKGSHATLRRDNAFTTIPARNNMLKTGLLLGILGDIMMNREEFVNDYDNGLVK